MIDLKKFKKDAKDSKMPEIGIFLLRKMQTSHDDLMNLIKQRTCHLARKAGHYTTTGGDAIEVIAADSVKESMKCLVQMHTEGATPVTIKSAKCGDGTLTVEFSADPADDHQISFFVFI